VGRTARADVVRRRQSERRRRRRARGGFSCGLVRLGRTELSTGSSAADPAYFSVAGAGDAGPEHKRPITRMGTLTITGGTLRSRRVPTPPGRGTRPTPARVKEALFSILGARVVDARVLDLFAGSGALGF